jgi:hypothetical protein
VSPNVQRVPSCHPCAYVAQFGDIECRGCSHNNVGKTATIRPLGAEPIYAKIVKMETITEPPRIPRRASSPHVERNRIRTDRTRLVLIVAVVWILLIVAAQARACVATSPQDAAAQQIEAMHAAGISTTGGRP